MSKMHNEHYKCMHMRSIAFFNKQPTKGEVDLLAKYLGTFRDGTGNYIEEDGTTRADYKQIEVCFAELLGGKAFGNKKYYDFCVSENDDGGITVRGASIKSKEKADLADYGKPKSDVRSYFEISNSSAADWNLCREKGLTEQDWLDQQKAEAFGEVILERQDIQRKRHQDEYLKSGLAKHFAESDSIFISLLYTKPLGPKQERKYLFASYPIHLPKPAEWRFRAPKPNAKSQNPTLLGLDAKGNVIYEWFALSGSQFKYYPRLADAKYKTDLISIPKPAHTTLHEKAKLLFGA